MNECAYIVFCRSIIVYFILYLYYHQESEIASLKEQMSALDAERTKQSKDSAEEIAALQADKTVQVGKLQKDAELLAVQVAAEKAAFEYEIDALRASLSQERADSAATRSKAVKMEIKHATHDMAAKLVFDTEFTVQSQQLVCHYILLIITG